MKLITGLFRTIRKSLSTTDNDMGMFRDKLNELVAGKDAMSDEEISAKVDEIVAITEDLPESEGKSELMRYLEDFKAVKEQEGPVAEKAAAAVADLFEKLDAEAMKDAPAGDEPAGDEPAAEETSVEAVAEETEAPAEEKKEEETGDGDPNPTYTLEEIWDFIKKRMQDDAACEETTDEEPEEKKDADEVTEDEDQDETTTDCAPRLNVTLNDHAVKGSLADLFNKAKNGGF